MDGGTWPIARHRRNSLNMSPSTNSFFLVYDRVNTKSGRKRLVSTKELCNGGHLGLLPRHVGRHIYLFVLFCSFLLHFGTTAILACPARVLSCLVWIWNIGEKRNLIRSNHQLARSPSIQSILSFPSRRILDAHLRSNGTRPSPRSQIYLLYISQRLSFFYIRLFK